MKTVTTSLDVGREVMDAIDLISVCQVSIKLSEDPDFFSVDRVLQLSVSKLLAVTEQLDKSESHTLASEVTL